LRIKVKLNIARAKLLYINNNKAYKIVPLEYLSLF